MKKSKTPIVSEQEIDPADLSSALQTLKPSERRSVTHEPIGLGHEKLLDWALYDIAEATKAGTADERLRASVNAVMHARRALSCLVDQYLQRDGFSFCKDKFRDTAPKAEILVRRGIFDILATQTLQRAVNRRNIAEHNYEGVELTDAQDTVQIVRATIQNSVAKSSPYFSPALFGMIAGGSGTSNGSIYGQFDGWIGAAFILVTTVRSPWLGVIVPKNDTEAVVRKVDLSKVTREQLFEALEIAESSVGKNSDCGSTSADLWHAQLRSAGLLSIGD